MSPCHAIVVAAHPTRRIESATRYTGHEWRLAPISYRFQGLGVTHLQSGPALSPTLRPATPRPWTSKLLA